MKFHFIYFSFFVFYACQNHEYSVGDRAPEFSKMIWLHSPELQLANLQGKVVLLRWWTDGCVFCVQSADALNEWHQRYADSGLVVIGLYHPKPEPRILDPEEVREFVREKGFQFPIGIDQDWTNLYKFWLGRTPKEFTSVSFLIGKDGKIIYIHPGGEYHKEIAAGHEQCVTSYFEIEMQIQMALRASFH
ncbi:MAG: TlpA family protein disulfide reductase [Saprospiraceae bacterium]|nr:TlpA family protein disulfide reductase [Saprospiraceae bacterium]